MLSEITESNLKEDGKAKAIYQLKPATRVVFVPSVICTFITSECEGFLSYVMKELRLI